MLKHRKPQKSILSAAGEFSDPYGRSGACFSKVLETFQAQMQILKSNL